MGSQRQFWVINKQATTGGLDEGDFDRVTATLKFVGPHTLLYVDNAAPAKELTYGTEDLVEDFTIRYLPTSHWVNQEAPDEVNCIVEAWLTGRPVPDFQTSRGISEGTK